MNIYILKNFTLQEIFFDTCETGAKEAAQAHKSTPDSPISHWKFDTEQIKWGIVQSDLAEGLAESFLTALRREPQDDGWTVIGASSTEDWDGVEMDG